MNEQDKHDFILNHVALHKRLCYFFHLYFIDFFKKSIFKQALTVFELATNTDIFSLYVNECPYNPDHSGIMICLCFF